MTSQERQFYIAILFNACRYNRACINGNPDRTNHLNRHLVAAIDHIANALRTPAFEIVR